MDIEKSVETLTGMELDQAVVRVKWPDALAGTVVCNGWRVWPHPVGPNFSLGMGATEPEAWADAADKVIKSDYVFEQIESTGDWVWTKTAYDHVSDSYYSSRALALESAKRDYIQRTTRLTSSASAKSYVWDGRTPEEESRIRQCHGDYVPWIEGDGAEGCANCAAHRNRHRNFSKSAPSAESDRLQGVDFPDCEDGTEHSHTIPATSAKSEAQDNDPKTDPAALAELMRSGGFTKQAHRIHSEFIGGEPHSDDMMAEFTRLQEELGVASAKSEEKSEADDFRERTESFIAYLQDRINETGRNANPFFADVKVDESLRDLSSWRDAIYAIQDETRRTYSNILAAAQERIRELEQDSKRLDWLEARRISLNRRYGTEYGWKFISSHNVNRLLVRDVNTIDLNDSEPRGTDIRKAIDDALSDAALRTYADAKGEGK